jgi:hypothetical protein
MNTSTFRKGDTFAYVGPVRQRAVDGTLTAFNLTGWSVSASMERAGPAGPGLALSASITDAANGIVRVDQTAANTATWSTGQYEFKLRLTSPAGAVVSGGTHRIQVIA